MGTTETSADQSGQVRSQHERPSSGLVGRIRDFFLGTTDDEEQSRANRGWIFVLGGVGLVGIFLIWLLLPVTANFAAGALIAVAAAMAGSLLGFLFGLPRARRVKEADELPLQGTSRTQDEPADYDPNTNLDDISDWLTKILVGVGLTQIGSVPEQFERLVNFVRPAIGDGAATGPVVAAVVTAYLIIGFLASYLWARTRAAIAFRLAHRRRIELEQRLEKMHERVGQLEAAGRAARAG